MNIELFEIFLTILDALILSLHTLGLYLLLCVQKGRYLANHTIITWLSCIEIIYSITSLSNDITGFVDYDLTPELEFVIFITNPVIQFIVLLITINRFVGCMHPVFYKKFVTKKVVRFILLATCVTGVVTGSGLWSAVEHYHDVMILLYWLTTGITATFIAIVYVYSRIYFKLAASTLMVSRHLPGRKHLKLRSVIWNFIFHKGYATSLLIAVSYIVFILVPCVWFLVNRVVWDCMIITFRVHYIIDALIYVYTDKMVRKVLVKKVRRIVARVMASNRVDSQNH